MTIDQFLQEARRRLPGEKVFVQQLLGESYLRQWTISIIESSLAYCVGTSDDPALALEQAENWKVKRAARNRERVAKLEAELAELKANQH